MNLNVKYLGLELSSPVIAASSPFTASIDRLRKLDQMGIGAVVLKSVFEEQIAGEAEFLERYNDYPEAADYLQNYLSDDYLKGHLNLVSEAKKQLKAPVIASINCLHAGSWVDYARKLEKAGADAIELNIFILPTDAESSLDIEKRYIDIATVVANVVNIPVSVKLGSRFTNIINMVSGLYRNNVKGVVMFNRFFEPDIDTDTMTVTQADPWSGNNELRNNLRPVALCSSSVPNIDLCVTTGIHTGDDIIKCMLAGAHAAQIATAIHVDGPEVICRMNEYIAQWMDRHTVNDLSEIIGKLNFNSIENGEFYQRSQYMRFFPKG